MIEDLAFYVAALELASRTYSGLDAADADAVVACFAPNATWHRPSGPASGKDAIRAVAAGRDPRQETSHVVSGLVVTLDGDRRVARYCITVYGAMEGSSPHLHSQLLCEDVLVGGPADLKVLEKRAVPRFKFTA